MIGGPSLAQTLLRDHARKLYKRENLSEICLQYILERPATRLEVVHPIYAPFLFPTTLQHGTVVTMKVEVSKEAEVVRELDSHRLCVLLSGIQEQRPRRDRYHFPRHHPNRTHL